MEAPSVRVLCIAPYDSLKAAIERAVEAYPGLRADVHTGDLEEGVEIVRRSSPGDYDAILSRGGTAEMIRRVTDLPVIEIRTSVYDVLRSIKLAQNYSSRYAIVGFPSITEPAHILCDLLRYDIDIITVRSAQEVKSTLYAIKEKGYRMVVSDMVTHTVARELGLDAFLITSGAESLHDALALAQLQGASFRRLRRENLLLRRIVDGEDGHVAVLRADGSLVLGTPKPPPEELLTALRARLGDVPPHAMLRFTLNALGTLHAVCAQSVEIDGERLLFFHCHPTQIPLRGGRLGIRTLGRAECEHLFMNSFYSIGGVMGELESRLTPIASTRQAVMILGETGTGKEQIARAVYLRSPLANSPLVTVDCALMDEKNWDYLLGHHASPLSDSGSTVYFQHMESLPATRQSELLSLITETGMIRRVRLIFSCNCPEGAPLPEAGRAFASRLSCLVLRLPTLRSRSDEIPSLASLYLCNLNLELGKQISGFDPHAAELLRQYDWPHNYTQFTQVLHELATLATSPYIRSSAVAELLAKQRAITRGTAPAAQSGVPIEGRTLEQITRDVIEQTVAAHGGNQTGAARALGISRTTLWRVLGKNK